MAKRSKAVFAAFQKGDASACRDVQAWVKEEVRKYARGRRDLQNDREDLCQEILFRLSDSRRNNPAKIKNLGAYIYVVTKTTCIDFLDKHQGERAWYRTEVQARPPRPKPPARMDSDDSCDVVPQGRERLRQVLTASLEYIDLAFQWHRAYRDNTDRMSRTLRPFLKARATLQKAAAVEPMLQAQVPKADQERLIGPLVAELLATRQRLDEEIRAKIYAPGVDGPDHPLDFNAFLPDVILMRLQPATLIFRVWSKIIKKGSGRYTDYSYMSDRYFELQRLYKGTEKEYLFKGAFKPKALRVEAHKRSAMKAFYDRLAEWIYQKAREEQLSLDEALADEDAHFPPVHRRGLMVLPLSD